MHVLFLLHAYPSPRARGGVELHAHDLLTCLEGEMDFTVAVATRHGVHVMPRGHRRTEESLTPLPPDEDARAELGAMLDRVRPDLLHIHHIMGSSHEIAAAAAERGIPVIFSVHDYHLLSPSITLTDERGVFLGIPGDDAPCGGMRETHGAWRARAAAMLRHVDGILAPSRAALGVFRAAFGDVRSDARVVPHGWGDARHAAPPPARTDSVCFLGAVAAPHKGRFALPGIVRGLAARGIGSVVLGAEAERFPELCGHPAVRFLGMYDRATVADTLRGLAPGAVCIPSQWPETFCYALSEAWAAGLPAYVTPIGAQAERVAETGAGRVAPGMEPAILADDLASYLGSDAWRASIETVRRMALRTRDDMARDHREIYASARDRRSLPASC